MAWGYCEWIHCSSQAMEVIALYNGQGQSVLRPHHLCWRHAQRLAQLVQQVP